MRSIKQILITVVLFFVLTSCEELGLCSDNALQFSRVDYTSNELKTDGYFFGDVNRTSSTPFANIYYLYRNGVFFTTFSEGLSDA